MTITRDQVAAVMRHVYTAVGAAVAAAVALGAMGQEDADRAVVAVQHLGEGLGIVIGAIAALLPIVNAMRAGRSASPSEQVRKVEENVPGVVVTPITEAGAELLKQATGQDKPVASTSSEGHRP